MQAAEEVERRVAVASETEKGTGEGSFRFREKVKRAREEDGEEQVGGRAKMAKVESKEAGPSPVSPLFLALCDS